MSQAGGPLRQQTPQPSVHIDSPIPQPGDPAHWAQAVLDASPSEIVVLAIDGTIVASNRAWRHFARDHGLRPGRSGIGVNYLQVLEHAADQGDSAVRLVTAGVRDVLEGRTTSYRTDYELRFDHGTSWFQMDVVQIPAGGAVVMHQDITWRKNLEQRLVHQATHDALTGLPNRVLVEDRIETAIQRAQRHKSSLAIMFCDIDRFKEVNDTYGHAVGDDVIIGVSSRIQNALRASDTLGRLSGDEFIVICDDAGSEGDLRILARRILTALRMPLEIENQVIRIRASIGIAMGRPQETSEIHTDSLLRAADAAMYRAKRRGGSRVELVMVH